MLEDTDWVDSLGHIRINEYGNIVDTAWEYYPWDTLELLGGQIFPNFHISSGYFNGVDTIITSGPASVSILSPDSGTATPFIWGRYQCLTTPWGTYRHHAVLSVIADYGLGNLIIVPEVFSLVWPHYYLDTSICELDLGDNRQFFRNLFTTNNRADSVWLSGSDSTFTVFLPHCTPFVAESTSFSFNSATYGLWLRHASDWCYWHTDSSITIQYPDTCPMGETFEVCIKLVPDATGETVLPTGAICDSFTFDYTGIPENRVPNNTSISIRPNPFNSSCRIFAPAGCEIEIYDINGRIVDVRPPSVPPVRGDGEFVSALNKGGCPEGTGGIIWQPDKSIGSGVFLVRAKFGDKSLVKRIVYLK